MLRQADHAPRFTEVERWVHTATGIIVAVLFATAAALYIEPVALLVGRRSLVELVHIVAGLALGVPMLVGLAISPELRADVRALDRMTRADREWLRRRDRRSAGLVMGKFNSGQKLAAAVMAGAGLVLLGTGLLLIAPVRVDLPDRVREGATIVHDLFTFGLLVLLVGHIVMAVRHSDGGVA
jgi:formate dehydrogenase subunit gamma